MNYKIKNIFLASAVLFLGAFLLNFAIESHAKAAGQDISAAVSKKVDQVIKNQQDISAKLDAIKEELRVIKIRVTQAQ